MLVSEGIVLDKMKVVNDAITTVRRPVTDITLNFCSRVPKSLHRTKQPFMIKLRRSPLVFAEERRGNLIYSLILMMILRNSGRVSR